MPETVGLISSAELPKKKKKKRKKKKKVLALALESSFTENR